MFITLYIIVNTKSKTPHWPNAFQLLTADTCEFKKYPTDLQGGPCLCHLLYVINAVVQTLGGSTV